MPGTDFDLGSIGRELAATERRIQRALVKGLRHAAVLSRNRVIDEIRTTTPHPPVDTGEMSRVSSWPITPILEGGKPSGWALDAATQQASIMEFGTRPFWPPLDPIVAWAKRKMRGKRKATLGRSKRSPGRKRPNSGGSGRGSGRSTSPGRKRRKASADRAAIRMAQAVRVAISKRGIKPRGFYARASAHFGKFAQQGIDRFVGQVSR